MAVWSGVSGCGDDVLTFDVIATLAILVCSVAIFDTGCILACYVFKIVTESRECFCSQCITASGTFEGLYTFFGASCRCCDSAFIFYVTVFTAEGSGASVTNIVAIFVLVVEGINGTGFFMVAIFSCTFAGFFACNCASGSGGFNPRAHDVLEGCFFNIGCVVTTFTLTSFVSIPTDFGASGILCCVLLDIVVEGIAVLVAANCAGCLLGASSLAAGTVIGFDVLIIVGTDTRVCFAVVVLLPITPSVIEFCLSCFGVLVSTLAAGISGIACFGAGGLGYNCFVVVLKSINGTGFFVPLFCTTR